MFALLHVVHNTEGKTIHPGEAKHVNTDGKVMHPEQARMLSKLSFYNLLITHNKMFMNF